MDMVVSVQRCYTVSRFTFQKIFFFWIQGIWMLLFPLLNETEKEWFLEYLILSLQFLQNWTQPQTFFLNIQECLHQLKQKSFAELTKHTLFSLLLRLQNQVLHEHQNFHTLLDWYRFMVFSQSLQIKWGKKTLSLPLTWNTFVVEQQKRHAHILTWLHVSIRQPSSTIDEKQLETIEFLRVSPPVFGPFLWIQLFFVTSFPCLSLTAQDRFRHLVFTLLPCIYCKTHSLFWWGNQNPTDRQTLFLTLFKLAQTIQIRNKRPVRTKDNLFTFFQQCFSNDWYPTCFFDFPFQDLSLKQKLVRFFQKRNPLT
jgi:hypothetical protein